MDIIQKYVEPDAVEDLSLVYLAKPIYGGWVTFTVHLAKKYNYRLYKVTKRSESKVRSFGYGIDYQNVCLEDLLKLPNLLITAIDKHYWHIIPHLKPNTKIVIHDPTELKMSKTTPNPLVQEPKLLNLFKVYTIRETVQKYLIENFKITSEFKVHPFFEYELTKEPYKCLAVTISRIDFDKNTDLILKANQLIQDPKKKVQIFGAENRLYVHHKLGELDFYSYWKGKFEKDYPLTHQDKDILKDTQYVVDMSIIKNDGGGSQYTFLEAIYQGCVLILHREWITSCSLFKEGVNCLAVETPEELASILSETRDTTKILKESRKLLKSHLQVVW
jgi:hypothetical protein